MSAQPRIHSLITFATARVCLYSSYQRSLSCLVNYISYVRNNVYYEIT